MNKERERENRIKDMIIFISMLISVATLTD